MFISKKNDISRYEFLVLLTVLFVLVGMIKPFWSSYYQEKLDSIAGHNNDYYQVYEADSSEQPIMILNQH